mmetsp:Transcript_115015/g.371711  ORF Transcript_115015/g.371711 Transcript_115015/m.371711 type:complete len:229 (+) Transcript_115015:202-888(+)
MEADVGLPGQLELADLAVAPFQHSPGGDLPASPWLQGGMHPLSVVLVGHPEDGDVLDVWMPVQDLLHLRGVDVDRARHDHVDLPVGDVEEAFLVEVADVSNRKIVPVAGLLCLLLLLVVPVNVETFGKDLAGLARFGDPLPAVVKQHDFNASDRLATRERLPQHLFGRHDGDAAELGCSVQLEKHRAEHVHDALLDAGRTGCAAAHDRAHGLQIHPGTLLDWHLQQPL